MVWPKIIALVQYFSVIIIKLSHCNDIFLHTVISFKAMFAKRENWVEVFSTSEVWEDCKKFDLDRAHMLFLVKCLINSDWRSIQKSLLREAHAKARTSKSAGTNQNPVLNLKTRMRRGMMLLGERRSAGQQWNCSFNYQQCRQHFHLEQKYWFFSIHWHLNINAAYQWHVLLLLFGNIKKN